MTLCSAAGEEEEPHTAYYLHRGAGHDDGIVERTRREWGGVRVGGRWHRASAGVDFLVVSGVWLGGKS